MRKDTKYKAVLFDLFGTLVHHCPKEEFSYLMEAMSSAMEIDIDVFTEHWLATNKERGIGALSIYENLKVLDTKLQREEKPDRYQKVVAIRNDFFAKRLIPRPETLKVLKEIKDKGYKLALISDCGLDIPPLFKKTPMVDFFDVLIFSCDVKVKKPDKQIYDYALSRLNLNPEDAVFVGDGGSNELSGAKNAGIFAVRLNDNLVQDSFRYNAEPDWKGATIDNLNELDKILIF